MGSIAVFVLGIAAIGGAIWLIVQYQDSTRPPPLDSSSDIPPVDRFMAVAQRTSGMLSAAVVAAALVPGMGGRLMMRILAVTSPDSAQGLITDADEVVGAVTFGGSFAFVLFIAIFGGLVSLSIYVLFRRWFPMRSLPAGVVAAGIGGGLFARPTGLLDPDSLDFRILSPVWLAVFCAVALLFLYGVLLAVLVDRWGATWPPIDRSWRGMLALQPGVAIFLVSVLAVVPAIAILLVVAAGVFLRPRVRYDLIERSERVGRGIMIALSLAGTAWVAVSSVQILRL